MSRKPVVITTTIAHINKVLGTNLTSDEVVKIFDRLNFATELACDSITVTVPNRRWDIFIDADLIEEVARIYGYDNLESTQWLCQKRKATTRRWKACSAACVA